MLKGLFLHVFAKIVFVLCTYSIHLYLGKTLSSSEYGTIGVVISIITVNYNFLSNGARQAASKLLATNKYDEKDVIKKSIYVQASIAFILTAINWFGANLFAYCLNAPEMSTYIKLSALIIPFTAGHFICVGIINGLKLFTIEAMIVTIYPLLRLSVIPYVRYIFEDGAVGTVIGFLTAAVVCCIIGTSYLIKKRKCYVYKEERVAFKSFLSNMSNFLVFFTCITIILNVDMLIVNALVTNADYVGYYTGAVNFSKVSYYLLSAIYIVVLPTITQLYSQGKIKESQATIVALNNSIALFILPIVSIVGATTTDMLSAFYREEYRVASNTATILMCSQFLIGLFVVINMCISSTNNKRFSTWIALNITVIDFILCYLLTKKLGNTGAAISSLIIGMIGCTISFAKAKKIFGNLYDNSTVKLIVCNIILFTVTKIISSILYIPNLFVLLIIYATIYFLFIGLMIITKQVDIRIVLKTFTKGSL